jgi:hypothetical protein
MNSINESRWLGRYEELQTSHKREGHCRVPTSVSKLGRWVFTQRQAFKKGNMKNGVTRGVGLCVACDREASVQQDFQDASRST